MAISGIFYGTTGNAWIKPKIQWSAQADPEGFFSDVTATLSYTRTNTGFTTSGHWEGTLTIGGDSKTVSGVYVRIVNGSDTVTLTHTVRIPHDSDGTKTITISATGTIADTTLTYTDISAQVVLEQIPGAASISATDADIGAVSLVSIGGRKGDYTYTVGYRFGQLQGYLAMEGLSSNPVHLRENTIPFTLPEFFYGQIPDSPTGECTLICTTWQQGKQVGQPRQTTFTVRANPKGCSPLLSVQVSDDNPVTVLLTGNPQTFIRYASRLRCQLTCQGCYGAKIVERRINGALLEGDTLVLPSVSADRLQIHIVDSRGYTAEETVSLELIPYVPPTGRMQVQRTDATSGNAQLEASGSFFAANFGARENTLQLRCRVNQEPWQILDHQAEGSAYQVSAVLSGLTYNQSHTVTLQVSDSIQTVSFSAHVNPGIPVFDWGAEDFRFRVPVQAPEISGLQTPVSQDQATNKAYVDTALQSLQRQLSGMDLLWENRNPGSGFAAQTLALELSGYDFLEVWCAYSTEYPDCSYCYRLIRGKATDATCFRQTVSAGVLTAATREIQSSDTGISFSDAYLKPANGNTPTTSDQAMIPVRIYGIRMAHTNEVEQIS